MHLKRIALLGLGWTALVAGTAGLFVPVLPTTVFWLVAAWAFARSRPELRDRLYGHPRFGRVLSDLLEHGVAARPVKRAALAGMALGFAACAALLGPRLVLLLAVALPLAAAASWVATRPEAAPRT